MRKIERFQKGMGIGGWLTNYKRFNVLPQDKWFDITAGDMEHFESYITERDIEYIASLGMDHVRLGFDQIVIEESPFVYRGKIVSLLHNFVDWCERYNMRPVLNMHKAIGNYCDILDAKGLMQSPELQDRFIAVWTMLEKEFAGDNEVVFELLNEVVNATAEEWNALAKRAVGELRAMNRDRIIVLGTTEWGNPPGLLKLDLFDDDNIIYTFHSYAPFEFTHQQGVLNWANLYYNRKMAYPSDDIERYREFSRLIYGNPGYEGFDRMDINFLRHAMKDAKTFADMHPDKIVWCGEFGTIRHCNIKYRENWMRDMITILKEWDMPYSVWNYLSTPNDGNRFSLVDDDSRKILSDELARIIRGEV